MKNNKSFSHYGDVTDAISIKLINLIKPDEIYNLSAQSHVAVSFMIPNYTANVVLGCLNILEAIKSLNLIQFIRLVLKCLVGSRTPQTEKTPFYPRSPCGVSKVFSHWMTINYERHIICLHAMEFCLITKALEEARHLLPEKLQLD